jgi:hypothetical protein
MHWSSITIYHLWISLSHTHTLTHSHSHSHTHTHTHTHTHAHTYCVLTRKETRLQMIIYEFQRVSFSLVKYSSVNYSYILTQFYFVATYQEIALHTARWCKHLLWANQHLHQTKMERDGTHAAFKKCNNKALTNYSYAIHNLWPGTAVTLQRCPVQILSNTLAIQGLLQFSSVPPETISGSYLICPWVFLNEFFLIHYSPIILPLMLHSLDAESIVKITHDKRHNN